KVSGWKLNEEIGLKAVPANFTQTGHAGRDRHSLHVEGKPVAQMNLQPGREFLFHRNRRGSYAPARSEGFSRDNLFGVSQGRPVGKVHAAVAKIAIGFFLAGSS